MEQALVFSTLCSPLFQPSNINSALSLVDSVLFSWLFAFNQRIVVLYTHLLSAFIINMGKSAGNTFCQLTLCVVSLHLCWVFVSVFVIVRRELRFLDEYEEIV